MKSIEIQKKGKSKLHINSCFGHQDSEAVPEKIKVYSDKTKSYITVATRPKPMNPRQSENVGVAPGGWW